MTRGNITVAALAAAMVGGCMQSHTMQTAVPLGKGQGAISAQGGGWYAVDDSDKEADENYAGNKPALIAVSGAIDLGVHDHVDVGLSAGLAGIGARAKLGAGKRGKFAAAVIPALNLGWGGRSADVTGLVTFGQVTVAGFWGHASGKGIKCTTCVEDSDAYYVFGGGVGVRLGPLRGGAEVQRWAYPAGMTVFLLQVGYWWNPDGSPQR